MLIRVITCACQGLCHINQDLYHMIKVSEKTDQDLRQHRKEIEQHRSEPLLFITSTWFVWQRKREIHNIPNINVNTAVLPSAMFWMSAANAAVWRQLEGKGSRYTHNPREGGEGVPVHISYIVYTYRTLSQFGTIGRGHWRRKGEGANDTKQHRRTAKLSSSPKSPRVH